MLRYRHIYITIVPSITWLYYLHERCSSIRDYTITSTVICSCILYSGLFSSDANFLEFHKWAHYSGKFILSCYMKFDCGSLLQNWHERNYVQMAGLLTLKLKSLKPWVASISVYNCSRSNSSLTLSGRIRRCRHLYCK